MQNQGPEGCYYAVTDYGSMWRRVFVLLVDATIVLVALVLMLVVAGLLGLGDEESVVVALAATFLLIYLYFIELERSRVRTVGLRLARLEVVDLNGHKPSRADMIARMVTAWLGPGNVLVDLFWIPSEPNRQALRDKFAGIYVIKKGAAPAGRGRVRYVRYFFFGMNWAFREVSRPPTEASPKRVRHPGT